MKLFISYNTLCHSCLIGFTHIIKVGLREARKTSWRKQINNNKKNLHTFAKMFKICFQHMHSWFQKVLFFTWELKHEKIYPTLFYHASWRPLSWSSKVVFMHIRYYRNDKFCLKTNTSQILIINRTILNFLFFKKTYAMNRLNQ